MQPNVNSEGNAPGDPGATGSFHGQERGAAERTLQETPPSEPVQGSWHELSTGVWRHRDEPGCYTITASAPPFIFRLPDGSPFIPVEILGIGTFGVVLKCWRRDGFVALKICKPSADNAVLARADREASVLALASGPGKDAVAALYSDFRLETWTVDTLSDVLAKPTLRRQDARMVPCLVLEFVEGRNLSDDLEDIAGLLSRVKQSPWESRLHRALDAKRQEVVTWLVRACDALITMHSLGVIHRDLKGANIRCLTDARGDSSVKVLDWGLAFRLPKGTPPEGHNAARLLGGRARVEGGDARHTQAGAIVGTPSHMSPEQALGNGAPIDGRSDIYSFGVILYQLLYGRAPFEAPTPMEVVRLRLDTDPSWQVERSVRPSLDLRLIAAKCLQRDPQKRYQDAALLKADLQRCLDGKPVHAAKDGLRSDSLMLYWTARVLRSNARTGVIATAVSTAATLGVMEVHRWDMRVREDARVTSERAALLRQLHEASKAEVRRVDSARERYESIESSAAMPDYFPDIVARAQERLSVIRKYEAFVQTSDSAFAEVLKPTDGKFAPNKRDRAVLLEQVLRPYGLVMGPGTLPQPSVSHEFQREVARLPEVARRDVYARVWNALLAVALIEVDEALHPEAVQVSAAVSHARFGLAALGALEDLEALAGDKPSGSRSAFTRHWLKEHFQRRLGEPVGSPVHTLSLENLSAPDVIVASGYRQAQEAGAFDVSDLAVLRSLPPSFATSDRFFGPLADLLVAENLTKRHLFTEASERLAILLHAAPTMEVRATTLHHLWETKRSAGDYFHAHANKAVAGSSERVELERSRDAAFAAAERYDAEINAAAKVK